MPITTRKKKVTFQKPFILPSIGKELPAGEYHVVEETLSVTLMGHKKENRPTHKLLIPDGIEGFSESIAKLNAGELQAAIDTHGGFLE